MKVEIVPAKLEHVPLILANLRDIDKDRLIGAKAAMEEGINGSRFSFAGFIDDDIACLWGLRVFTLLNEGVYLWLITTKLVEEHAFVFVRHSQMVADQLLKEYKRIRGWVLVDNELSVKWLRWLGCKLVPQEHGMLEFELKRVRWTGHSHYSSS